ncbi:hypothetical protein Taro_053966 [Colocasia esculenta]|uniref:Uncharacterized protein n=1 Tax=Colocasia esculenta TaxID=4460 RepID=A0A843XNN2_COLES|nr:hypothetical protein [Colocasia esculenta]
MRINANLVAPNGCVCAGAWAHKVLNGRGGSDRLVVAKRQGLWLFMNKLNGGLMDGRRSG